MNELTIPLNPKGNTHLYEQIYDYIRSEILEGRLTPGEKLPSSRSLAVHLQVSRSTVNLAYEQLLAEGYLEVFPYRGYFISKMDKPLRIDRQQINSLVQGSREEVFPYHFTPNGIDMKEFPYRTWRRITNEVLQDAKQELFALGEAQGDASLREAIRKYLFAARGVICGNEQIIVGAGNAYLLMLLRLLLPEESIVAFENPTYIKAYKIMQSLNLATAIVDMDENGMKVDELERSGANIAYIMPSHQFPTGIVTTIGRRAELLKWATDEENRYLIEDDYDSEFRYRGKPIPALQGMDAHDRVIYMGTFSKAIAPAIRVSYLVLPHSLVEIYRREAAAFSSTVSRIDQKILEKFIGCGAFERHLNRMRKIYRGKHDCILEELKPFRHKFEIHGDYAGSHILLTARFPVAESWLIKRAEEKGVRVYGISEYILKPEERTEYSPTIILGYTGMDVETICRGIQLLAEVWL